MSYSFSVPAGDAADFETAADKALADFVHTYEVNDWTLAPETREAAATAIAQAKAVIATGIVGTGKVLATISGHANPDHKPAAGYANDTVSISLSCADTITA